MDQTYLAWGLCGTMWGPHSQHMARSIVRHTSPGSEPPPRRDFESYEQNKVKGEKCDTYVVSSDMSQYMVPSWICCASTCNLKVPSGCHCAEYVLQTRHRRYMLGLVRCGSVRIASWKFVQKKTSQSIESGILFISDFFLPSFHQGDFLHGRKSYLPHPTLLRSNFPNPHLLFQILRSTEANNRSVPHCTQRGGGRGDLLEPFFILSETIFPFLLFFFSFFPQYGKRDVSFLISLSGQFWTGGGGGIKKGKKMHNF